MSKKLLCWLAFVVLAFMPLSVCGQEKVAEVSSCDLARNPKAFDGKQIRVRAGLNAEFEDFSLGTENCKAGQGIWLTFGGDVPGIVPSTVNDNFRKRGTNLKVGNVSYGIRKDDNFRKLYALLAARRGMKPQYKVTATILGTFLAGEQEKMANGGERYAGYGHLGCCSLLIIEQVFQVESTPRANLDLRGTLVGPDKKPVEGFTVIDDVLGGNPPERQTGVTNRQGEFFFTNSGKQLRIENPAYRPLSLTVEPGGAPVRVMLEPANKSDWILPVCNGSKRVSQAGFSVQFALPNEMESSPFESDGQHSIFIYPRDTSTSAAELIISNWSEEVADTADSLGSEWFEERWVKDQDGNVIGMDARGRARRGGFWRTATFFKHDTAGYRLQQGQRQQSLDQIMDSACRTKP